MLTVCGTFLVTLYSNISKIYSNDTNHKRLTFEMARDFSSSKVLDLSTLYTIHDRHPNISDTRMTTAIEFEQFEKHKNSISDIKGQKFSINNKNLSMELFNNKLRQENFNSESNETGKSTVNADSVINTAERRIDYAKELSTMINIATTVLEKRKVNRNENDEKRHIAFLKVHKAASTTVQTILYRFGYTRNLSFALPVGGHYFSKSTMNHRKLIQPKNDNHYDIVCNHGYFNYTVYSSVMPKDTVYIAIVREPFKQFISAFNYYRSQFRFSYLINIPGDAMTNLIKYPEIYEESNLSYTMNSMAKDFGFQMKHYLQQNFTESMEYLEKLGAVFDIVLITEFLDESLILMKRILNWSLKDVLYISKNVRGVDTTIDKELMEIFKRRNKLDYLVYEYFQKKFHDIVFHKMERLQAETLNFKHLLKIVHHWCVNKSTKELMIEKTEWNESFNVTHADCQLMATEEMAFIKLLRGR